MELKGKTALITGSTGRLGVAITKALACAGCDCICHYYRNKPQADELVAQIKAMGNNAIAIQANLATPKEIELLFEARAEFGITQVLINSAAVFSRSALQQITFEDAQKVMNLNLIAAILTSKAFAEQLDKNFPSSESIVGKIINIADIGAIRPWAQYVLYCSSKAGLIGATKALAKELAPRVCVNSISPGIVTWPDGSEDVEKKKQLSLIPMDRFGQPDEITRAIIFLLENDYIIGQNINIDGGRVI